MMRLHIPLCLLLALVWSSFSSCQNEKVSTEGLETTNEAPSIISSSERNQKEVEPLQSFQLTSRDLHLLEVKNQDKAVHFPITGRVIPKNTTVIAAEVQGRILSDNFKLHEGTKFRSGETLLALDKQEFALQLESQRSAFLNQLTAMIPDIKADYAASYPHWMAYLNSYKKGKVLSPLPEPKSDEERYFVIANKIYSTFYAIKAQEERLTKFSIQAPFSGIVTQAQAGVGALVSPSQPLATLISTNNYELEAGVNLAVVPKLKQGDKVQFESKKTGETFTGILTRVNEIVDPSTQNVPVYFRISGKNLKSGMYLEGSFVSQTYENVTILPVHLLTRDNKVLVFENAAIESKPVKVIEVLRDSVLVSGLSDQSQVILNQFDVPVEGLKISIR